MTLRPLTLPGRCVTGGEPPVVGVSLVPVPVSGSEPPAGAGPGLGSGCGSGAGSGLGSGGDCGTGPDASGGVTVSR